MRNRQGAISVFARFNVERRIVLFFFAWGRPAASLRFAAAAVTRRVQRYTNADMPAILGRGLESSSASSFRRACDLIEIALAGAPIFLHWYGSQAYELQRFYEDMLAGRRPKLAIMAPPQHGKSWAATDFAAWVAGATRI